MQLLYTLVYVLMQAPLLRLTGSSLFIQNPSCIVILSPTTSSWAWVDEQIRYTFWIMMVFIQIYCSPKLFQLALTPYVRK